MTWKMIDAVTYGMIPSAKIENRDSAEPEKRFSSWSTPPWEPKKLLSAAWLTPGAGTHEPNRYTARMPAVNSRRRRSSGTRQTLVIQANI